MIGLVVVFLLFFAVLLCIRDLLDNTPINPIAEKDDHDPR